MASSFSTRLRIDLPADADTGWGTIMRTDLGTLLEEAIAGYTTKALSDANYTLSTANGATDEARQMMLKFTGTLTANRNITVPTSSKLYFIENATTGGFSLNIKTSAGTGIAIVAGEKNVLFCDGVNVLEAITRKPGYNAIINGDMNIWQRGTTFTSIASGAYFADRYYYGKVGAMVHDALRSTDVPTVASAGRLFNYSALIDCTTTDAAIAAGDYCSIQQNVEGFNFLPLAQRTFTCSFWVKATKIGTYCVAFSNSAADRSYVVEYTVNVTDTWEYKTVTVTASPSAGTWDYTTGIGLRVIFALACGSTFQTTANAWQVGSFFGTANQVNACDSTSNNFRITGVKLEPGSVATMSQPKSFSEELAACQRYFEKSFPYATAPAQNVGAATGEFRWPVVLAGATVNRSNRVRFSVSKRATPTITFYNPSAANVQVRDVSLNGDCSASNTSNTSDGGFEVTCTANAGSGVQNWLGIHWDASAEL